VHALEEGRRAARVRVSRRGVQMKKETTPRRGAGRDGRLDGNIYITCTREGAVGPRAEREGERGRNYAMGTRTVRAAGPLPGIHIQIELYALPDALIRNHSTACCYPRNTSRPPPRLPTPRRNRHAIIGETAVPSSAPPSCRSPLLTNGNSRLACEVA